MRCYALLSKDVRETLSEIQFWMYDRNLTNMSTVLRRAVFRGLNAVGTDFQNNQTDLLKDRKV